MKAKNLLLTLAVGAMAISCNNSGSMTQTSASLKTTADSASFISVTCTAQACNKWVSPRLTAKL